MRKPIVLIAAIAVVLGGVYFARWNAVPADPSPAPAAETPAAGVVISSVGEGTLYDVVPGESFGRYLIREQLAGISIPIDAIGVTTAVTGQVSFARSGAVVGGSQIVVNLASLASDESRRDQYVRANILQTQRYPNAVFVPKEVRGIPQPVPTEGTANVVVVGDLTIRGVTREVVWEGTATFGPDEFTVAAKTTLTFAEFGLNKPRVAVVLSVDDAIRLEANIKLRRA